jgi:sugar phosphate isomerase/epimerase
MAEGVELLASYWTISAAVRHLREYSLFDFRDRVEAAARVGFKGFGLWHADLDHILEKRSLKEMKQIFDDNGIKEIELEFLTDWFLEGERKKQSDILKQKLLTAAEALQARHVKVGDISSEPYEMPRVIESFAALCKEAADHGTKIGFEPQPFSMINTLTGALEMVEGAGAANGGIVLDLWHIVKLGIPYDEVARIPKQWLVSVELDDGTFEAPWSLRDDCTKHRRLCGEGEFDIKSFIASVQQLGYEGPWGIEVLSEELRQWPLEKLATRSFDTTIAQFSA